MSEVRRGSRYGRDSSGTGPSWARSRDSSARMVTVACSSSLSAMPSSALDSPSGESASSSTISLCRRLSSVWCRDGEAGRRRPSTSSRGAAEADSRSRPARTVSPAG